jgi:hypothetical protein
MSELSGQLLSTKIQQTADGGSGHTFETALNELIDNEIDIGANKINLIFSKSNLCWAILGDGPGAANIDNLWGCGTGMKIKSDEKIGTRISGEFASAIFFNPNTIMYFSRTNNTTVRKHQQLNADISQMIEVIRIPDIDLGDAHNRIVYGIGNPGNRKLVRKPELDKDVFDISNVEQVKEWFNSDIISSWFHSDQTGILKIFKYEEANRKIFDRFIEDLDKIIDKNEFITYNTLKTLRTKEFHLINIDSNAIRVVNRITCSKNFILGTNAIVNDDSDSDDSDNDDEDSDLMFLDDTFDNLSQKVLYFTTTVYESEGVKYASCKILNYSSLKPFWISDKGCVYSGTNSATAESLKEKVFRPENIKSTFNICVSYLDETESEKQRKIFNNITNGTTSSDMKQIYVYFNGRFLDKSKIPLIGIHERNLPNLRIVVCFNKNAKNLMGPQALKSRIDLKSADKIFIDTLNYVIKPVLTEFSSREDNKQDKEANLIKNGISNWTEHMDRILSAFKLKINKPVAVPAPVPVVEPPVIPPVPSPTPPVLVPTPPVSVPTPPVSVPTPPVSVPPIPPPTTRGPAPTVLSALNKQQTIAQLNRIKTKLLSPTNPYKKKAELSKIFTKLSNIEKEILIDDDSLHNKINYLIEMVQESGKSGAVKHAAELQDI